jgi:hypothetical protein
MPSYNIDFYWPTSYYDPSSQVEIIYDTTSAYMSPESNSGNTTEDLTSNFMFNSRATYIPGAPSTEKSLKMYMRERRFGNDVADKSNWQDHEGPTIIMVRTSTSTTTSRYAYATSTGHSSSSSYKYNDDGGGKVALSPGAIAGIVVGVVLALILLIVCCCRQIKETSSAEQRRIHAIIDAGEQKRMNQQAMELMQQGNVQREVDGTAGVGVDGETLPVYTEAPPKYMP